MEKMKSNLKSHVTILKKIAIKGNLIKIWYKDVNGINIRLYPVGMLWRKDNNIISYIYNDIYRIV
jgi:hypothetical protein